MNTIRTICLATLVLGVHSAWLNCGLNLVLIADLTCNILPSEKTELRKALIHNVQSLGLNTTHPFSNRISLLTIYDKSSFHNFYFSNFTTTEEVVDYINTTMYMHTDGTKNCSKKPRRTDLAFRAALRVSFSPKYGLSQNAKKIIVYHAYGPVIPNRLDELNQYVKDLKDADVEIYVNCVKLYYVKGGAAWRDCEIMAHKIVSEPKHEHVRIANSALGIENAFQDILMTKCPAQCVWSTWSQWSQLSPNITCAKPNCSTIPADGTAQRPLSIRFTHTRTALPDPRYPGACDKSETVSKDVECRKANCGIANSNGFGEFNAHSKQKDLEQLKGNIQREIQNIPPELLSNVMNNVAIRILAVIEI
ncbi:unnamed protein product [Owenia fusiformis]|uniref:VWFA domain-containing protein n=1 Tax=Owenia fusiformis TaxID=6347 RepID=A0A8S4PD25_OWEFU|nr:unnamed protein product [Owenia fusiformis]